MLEGLLTRSYLGKHSELPKSFFWTITFNYAVELNTTSTNFRLQLALLPSPTAALQWASLGLGEDSSVHRLHWKPEEHSRNPSESLWPLCGLKAALRSLGIPGLCAKQTTIWTTEGPRGLGYRSLFCWTLESFLGSFSLLPTPRSFPLPNSFFKNVSCCFYNSACVWADVQESSLNKGYSEDRG